MASVVARIQGGLGNQMFMYAAGLAAAMRHNSSFFVDTCGSFDGDRYGRSFELGNFSISAPEATAAQISWLPILRRPCAGRVVRKCLRMAGGFRRHGVASAIFERVHQRADPRLFDPMVGSFYMDGYWQSEDYFADAEARVRTEFTPARRLCDPAMAFADEMRRCNSVAVHARRGRVARNRACEPALPSAYYAAALRLVRERGQDLRFYLFGDDPGWLGANISDWTPSINVSEFGFDGWEDLWLMVQCRHHIIADSTFSWWGAWLSNSRGVVVAPSDLEWFRAAPPPRRWVCLQGESFRPRFA